MDEHAEEPPRWHSHAQGESYSRGQSEKHRGTERGIRVDSGRRSRSRERAPSSHPRDHPASSALQASEMINPAAPCAPGKPFALSGKLDTDVDLAQILQPYGSNDALPMAAMDVGHVRPPPQEGSEAPSQHGATRVEREREARGDATGGVFEMVQARRVMGEGERSAVEERSLSSPQSDQVTESCIKHVPTVSKGLQKMWAGIQRCQLLRTDLLALLSSEASLKSANKFFLRARLSSHHIQLGTFGEGLKYCLAQINCNETLLKYNSTKAAEDQKLVVFSGSAQWSTLPMYVSDKEIGFDEIAAWMHRGNSISADQCAHLIVLKESLQSQCTQH